MPGAHWRRARTGAGRALAQKKPKTYNHNFIVVKRPRCQQGYSKPFNSSYLTNENPKTARMRSIRIWDLGKRKP